MRPIRDLQESVTNKIPEGPLGLAGKGNLIGLGGFGAVTFVNTLSPIPLGFDIQSSSVIEEGENLEVMKFMIWSASKDVATTIAKKEAAGPNLNFFVDDTSVMSVKQERERPTHSLWIITVRTERKGFDSQLDG